MTFSPAHLAHHVVEEDDRRNRVEEIEQRGACRQEFLQPHLPARGRLSRPLVGPREVQSLGTGEDQEEVEEDRRHQEQADRAGALHEDVDPPVRGGPQAADEEEQEEDAQEEEDPGRALLGHADEDEEPDEEEEETDDDRVEVGLSAEPLGRELDPYVSELLARGHVGASGAGAVTDQVVDVLADLVAAQLLRGVGARVDDAAADPLDALAGLDAGLLGRGPGEDHPDVDTLAAIGNRDDAVVRPGREHVGDRGEGDRQTGEADGQEPARPRSGRTPVRAQRQIPLSPANERNLKRSPC